MWFLEFIWKVYYAWFHHIYKWFIHFVTGQCELQRIMFYTPAGAYRTFRIESSLRQSKQLKNIEKDLLDSLQGVDAAVKKVVTIKKIPAPFEKLFVSQLQSCLSQLVAYKLLTTEVESLRVIPYSSDNQEHEADLIKIWKLLMPDTELKSRISKQWGDIGFQGDDPATDFRGMGVLALKNLLYFAENYTDTARQLLSHSNHPQYGYSYAIVGINLTHMALQLLNGGHLKTHFYNINFSRIPPQMTCFHQVYSHLFVKFDDYWISSKPKDIMEFNRVREEFYNLMLEKLCDNSTVLEADFSLISNLDKAPKGNHYTF